ncbi:DUF2080 family transposase-associated protein [Candidatus Micrarchaeota archaeon]|nr:DUF2080 family transposase-associated protein [Candidatus Micrarchaeota archaeon]MBU2477411.1 DUF2080 family transposase-associated protein [Candidatus Micrarchaeota archaeon]
MIKKFNVYGEVTKQVVRFGNGSIVYTPKKWIGQTVTVILQKEPLNVKEDVMKMLEPFLESVKGVFLFGSHARKEQEKDSDVDVIVIADRKFNLGKKGRFDAIVLDEETLRKELKGKDPFYLYSALQEAEPILNKELLEELKKIKINKKNFKWLLEESTSALKIAEEFLKMDKMQERKKLDSVSVIYTLMLRMKRIFRVQCILKNKKYSNKEFKLFLQKKGLGKEMAEKFYRIYRNERDEKKAGESVSVEEAEKLFGIVEMGIKEMKGN